MCVCCGARPDTRDHCPSKVLLDEPYPGNLPVVEACAKCNGSISLDEQYFACFLECVMCGTENPQGLKREKIARILSELPPLATDIQSTLAIDAAGGKIWQADMARVKKVVLKLARCHLHYELGLHEHDEPSVFEVAPLEQWDPKSREFFERPEPELHALWPELGSSAFMRAVGLERPGVDGWQIVQEGRCRYLTGQRHGNYAHIAIGEYLACRVAWD